MKDFAEFKSRATRPTYTDYMGKFFSKPAIRLSYLFARYTSITPNEITALSLIVALIGAVMIQAVPYWIRLLGIVVWFVGYVLDLCDGDIARYRNMRSDFGHWFEAVSDRVRDIGLFTAVTILAVRESFSTLAVLLGMLALGGTIVHAYAITYGFKATESSASLLERFGNIDYALMAVLLILDQPVIFLGLVVITSFGALIVNLYSTKRKAYGSLSSR